MMETIPQITWTNTIGGRIIYCNQRWYDYTGLNHAQTDLSGFRSVIHPEDLRNTLLQFKTVRKTTTGGEFQTRAKREDGLYRWHLVRLMPITDEVGQMHFWVGTATDIQELRILQQQKDDFISIASHELKTPLTGLKASLQLLDRIKDNPTSAILPKLIEQSNKSMGKVIVLIDDLLNASMANTGQLEIHPKRLVLADVINDCCQDVRAGSAHNLTTEGDLSIEVYADAVKIEQIIVNFVNNAIKYAPDSKDIVISIVRQNNMVKISVVDKGPGIQTEKLRYLFDRYYRIENNGTQYSGLGLGLYICAEIVKKHHGQIGAESELGVGSSFWFTLPIV
jgi:PAS domain S-box-containing protein